MTPVSMTWGMTEGETIIESTPFDQLSHGEPVGPFALADVLTEIVARYATRPPREQPLSVSWLTIHGGTASLPVMQR